MEPKSHAAAGSPPAESPVRLVYIMGNVRSGSTLLDTILGNHPRIESVGELCNVSENGWIDQRRCACGQAAPDCPFWTEVRQEWARLTGTDDEQSYAELVRAMEKHRVWLPRLVGEARRRSPRFKEYAERTGALFQAIRTTSGKSVLVDSSKRASRALLLSKIPGIDLRVIHLVRDGRGVAWSEKKRKFKKDQQGNEKLVEPGKSVPRTALVWNVGNLQSAWVRRRLPPWKSARIRYEDCVMQPERSLAEIGGLMDLDLSGLAADLLAGQPMSVGHTIAGNGMRMGGSIRLRPDTEWIEKMSRRDRWACWSVSGWLMKQYGYSRQPDLSFPVCRTAPLPVAAESNLQNHREKAA